MTFALVASAACATRVLITVPFHERIFADMLGSIEKLPLLTKWMIGLHPGSIFASWIIFVGSLLVLWLFRRPSIALFLAGLGLTSLILLIVIHSLCFEIPLIQIIQGINSNV